MNEINDVEEYQGTITTKGQVTLPRQIRQLLGVQPHDKIIFRVSEGKVELQATTSLSLEDTFGAVTPRKSPEDFAELRATASDDRVQKVIEELHRFSR